MNCPQCQNGVLEMIAYIPIKAGPLELNYGRIPNGMPAINQHFCNRDDCGHVHMEAAPESLFSAKRLFRESAYAAGNCPNTTLP